MPYSDEDLAEYIHEKNFRISQLITAEEKLILQKLIEEISAEFNIATTLSDPDGTPVFPYCNFTELCQEHIRGCEEGLKRCKMQANMQGSLSEKQGEPLVYECHAGIIDFTAPIMLLNRRIGNVSGGQVWTKKPDKETYEKFARYFDEIGVIDKEKALASIRSQKVNDPSNIRKLASIYHNIGKLLSNYFHFQAEYGYWKKSLIALNTELEKRIQQRTKLLEETVNDLNVAQDMLRAQNRELRRNAEIQTVLREISETAVLSNSLEDLYATVHRLLQRVLPAKNLYISLLDAASDQIVRPYYVDETNSVLPQRPVGKGMTEYFMRLGRAGHVSAEEHARLRETGNIDHEAETAFEWLGAPLTDSRGRAFGVIILLLNEETHPFPKEDCEVLSIIAAQVSMAIERKQAENALRESEEYQVQLLNQLQEAIVITNRKSQIIYWNKTAESLFGYAAEEAHGRNSSFLIAGDGAAKEAQNHQIITTTMAGGRSTTEIMARHSDGRTFPAQLFSVLLKDMSGEFSGIAMFSVDLSRLRTAEETIDKIKLDHERQILLTKLIENNDPGTPESTSKAAALGLDWAKPFTMIVLEVEATPVMRVRGASVFSQLVSWVGSIDQELCAWEYRNAVAVINFDGAEGQAPSKSYSKWFKRWEIQLHQIDPKASLVMGIGQRGASLGEIQKAYMQARQAAWFCKVVNGIGAPCHFRDLGIFQLLTPIWDSNLDSFGQQVLGKLLVLKESKRDEYMETLEALLIEGTQKTAAEKLFVHEKTIQFRKQRIEEVLGYSIDSPAQRMALSLAMRWWKGKSR